MIFAAFSLIKTVFSRHVSAVRLKSEVLYINTSRVMAEVTHFYRPMKSTMSWHVQRIYRATMTTSTTTITRSTRLRKMYGINKAVYTPLLTVTVRVFHRVTTIASP